MERADWLDGRVDSADARFHRIGVMGTSPAGGVGFARTLRGSAVLAALRVDEALAQFIGKGDNADGDEVVLECARCPGPGAGQERPCGQWVAQAQDELRPWVDGGCYPGQLEGIGEDLVLLRALRRPLVCPALDQDGPAPVGAVNLDAFPGRDGDGGWVQLKAKPRAEEVKHHPFCTALLSGVSCRHGSIRNRGRVGGCSCPGNGCARRPWDASGFPVPESFIDDLAVRALPTPHRPRALERPADLVHCLARRDADARGDLVVIQGPQADPDRCRNALAMAVRRHA